MKPAPFIRHVPRTLDEAVKILAEVAPQDGRVLAGGQSLVPIMAFRLAKPAHLVDINEVEGLDKIASDGKIPVDRRLRAPCRVSQIRGRQPARRAAHRGRAPHRALSDPHARHVLRQSCACRSGVGMVPDRGDARCRDRREEHARRTADRGEGFLCRHHVDRPGRGRTAGGSAAAAARGRRQIRLQRVQPPRRRFRHERVARHLSPASRQDRRGARRRRRRRALPAPHCAKPKPRSTARRPATKFSAPPPKRPPTAIDPLEDHQTTADYRRDLVRAVVRRALEQAAS